ncbi:MAG: 2-phospho-L-lactate guanylyltransferase [Pseudolabrys sp.]|nr:2-phospho-L-lactate guanylyltransferase [Pseudolabrys sp.]
MPATRSIWAVIPVKEVTGAKQRLNGGVPPHLHVPLVRTMLEDVVAAVSQARGLAGFIIATLDPVAQTLAQRHGGRIFTDDARSGHTGVVAAAARRLAAEGADAILQLPGDIPLVTATEIDQVIALHQPGPSFTIVPSHDDKGSNTVVVSPPTAVPLKFGDDSFYPHLKSARDHGIMPQVVRLPGIARDIDHLEDLIEFARLGSATRTQAFLDRHDFIHWGRVRAHTCDLVTEADPTR